MEYIDEAETIDKALIKTPQKDIVKTLTILFQQIAITLIQIHEKEKYHRDIKPANIIVQQRNKVAKLMDFGFGILPGKKIFDRDEYPSDSYRTPKNLTLEEADIYKLGMTFEDCLDLIESKIPSDIIGELKELVNGLINKPCREALENFNSSLEKIGGIQGELFEKLLKKEQRIEGKLTQEKEDLETVLKRLSKDIVTLSYDYGEDGKIKEMEECITVFRSLGKEHSTKEIEKNLARVLVCASYYYSIVGRPDEIKKCLNELRELYNKYPQSWIIENFAMSLVNAVNGYGKAGRIKEMKTYLKELRNIYKSYHEMEIEEILATGLLNSVNYYGVSGKIGDMEKSVKELSNIYKSNPKVEIREWLSKGMFNSIVFYIKNNIGKKAIKVLKELLKLYNNFPGDDFWPEILERLEKMGLIEKSKE